MEETYQNKRRFKNKLLLSTLILQCHHLETNTLKDMYHKVSRTEKLALFLVYSVHQRYVVTRLVQNRM